MFRARIFRGNSGPAQNVASRLDETQNFASRLDETTGFDRYCQICERVVSGNPRDRRRERASGPVFFTISMSEPLMPEACLGNNCAFALKIALTSVCLVETRRD